MLLRAGKGSLGSRGWMAEAVGWVWGWWRHHGPINAALAAYVVGLWGAVPWTCYGGTHAAGLVMEERFLLLVYTEKENLGSRTCHYSC